MLWAMSAATQLANVRDGISERKRYFNLTAAEIAGTGTGIAISGLVTNGMTLFTGMVRVNYIAGAVGLYMMLTANRAQARNSTREFVQSALLAMAATDVFQMALGARAKFGFAKFFG
jgi:hypothetical protein